ncbi:ribonuclease H-like domain-containing protein [Tanacetum coccineum]
MTHPHPNRIFIPQVVLTKSGKINTAGASVNIAAKQVNTAGLKPTVNHPRSISNAYKRGYSQVTRPFNKYSEYKNSIFNKKVNTIRVKDTTARDRAVVSENKGKGVNAVKASSCWGNLQHKEYKEKGVIDSGCSRHITGNKCYLIEYEDYDGGFVSFGDGIGRISRKGKIKTGTLDFDNVYFCKELKYNLFSVSQIHDKKNNVLFTDIECLVLSSNFKLLDKSQVLLRVPRKDNIYSVDLKSVVPTKGLTCLFAKAIIDESNLWHRRHGRINFKNMNKLVRGNLVRGLPLKIFENDHSCVACQKGKQHKASSTKDETSGILKAFITEIENQLDHKVKVIRCNNETEFKNSVMNQFCEMNGIKREFSVARTPQQNGNGPDWLFDVNSLTISMNCVPVVAGNQTNGIVGTRDNIVADPKVSEEDVEEKPTEMDESGASDKEGKDKQATRSKFERILQQEQQTENPNNTNSINTISTPVSAAGPYFTNDAPSSPVNIVEASNAFEEHLFERFSPFKNAFSLPPISNVTPMDDTGIFGNAYDDEDVGAEADLNNLETTMNVSPIPTTRIDNDHPKDQIIGDFNSAIQTRRITKISNEHAMVCYINKQRRTNHKYYQNCLFACFLSQMEPKKVIQALEDPSWIEAMQEELLQFQLQKVCTLVNLPNGKRAIGIKWVFRNKKDERWIIMDVKSAFLYGTIEEEVYVCQPPGFEDLQFPNKVYKTGSTPMEPNKALIKDEEADITPKTSHLHAMKRIFRFLKVQPKLGLWYPRDSPFDLEAFSDSDYAGASLDRKSTTGGVMDPISNA